MLVNPCTREPIPETYFAPAARASDPELKAVAQACLDHPAAKFFIQAAGGLVMILDSHRQVLATNALLDQRLAASDPHPFGRRPGEVFGCIHASEGPGGCGTSPACAHCGAVLAVLQSQAEGTTARRECHLTLRAHGRLESVEFQILASPLDIGPHHLTAVVLQDLSATKRREALERLFYHDVANLMQGIRGWTELVAEGGISSHIAASKLLRLTDLLDRELRSHQDMARAESGHLHADHRPVRPSEVLADVRDLLDRHPSTRHREIRWEAGFDPLLHSDPELLSRVVLNMAVNALEATSDGARITLTSRRHGPAVRLEVRNPGEIPPDIRSRIFLRSFSTKEGLGRGLGTYAMKLFGENVLGGQVGFECAQGETVFYLELPLPPE